MTEASEHILKSAIRDLPSKEAPEALWGNMVNALDQEGLQKTISQLEEKQAPDSIWEVLDHNLAGSSPLRSAIEQLPQRELSDDLLPHLQNYEKPKTRRLYWASGIAASLILIVSLVFVSRNGNHSQLSFSQEVVDTPVTDVAFFESPDTANEIHTFVQSNCVAVTLKCDTQEFQDLYHLYNELEETYAELKAEAVASNNELQLIEYLIEVEKEKTEIGKQLISYIMS